MEDYTNDLMFFKKSHILPTKVSFLNQLDNVPDRPWVKCNYTKPGTNLCERETLIQNT